MTSTVFTGASPHVIPRAVLHSCRYLLCGIWRFRGWGSRGGQEARGAEPPWGWRGGYSGLLGGTLSTRTEITGGSLPSDPVLISSRIPRLYPLSHASIPACLPSPLSLSLPSPLRFSRDYYAKRISHCIILHLTRDVPRCRACSANQAESSPARRRAGLFLFGFFFPLPLPLSRVFLLPRAPNLWNFYVFPVSFREASSARYSSFLQASLTIHGYLIPFVI